MTDTTSKSGNGRQDPSVGNDDFNSIAFMVRQMMLRMATTRLVQVKAVHPGEGSPPACGTVDVLPLVQQIDGSGQTRSHGTVYGIPVLRIQGGKSAIIIDPKVDDIGYVTCCDRDISVVKSKKKESPPGSWRTFSLSDGIYVGSMLAAAPQQYIWFEDEKITVADKSGNKIILDTDGISVTDKSNNTITLDADGISIIDKSNNQIVLDSSGTTITDVNNNQIALDSSGATITDVAGNQIVLDSTGVTVISTSGNQIVLDASGITATDQFGHVLQMNAAGVAVTGNLSVTGNIAATGSFTADGVSIGGGVASLAGDLGVSGTITSTGDVVGAGISLQTHIHTSAAAGSPTSPPIP